MALFALVLSNITIAQSDLQPLAYNNPGLEVDLAVGLWAWPLPMDYDQDGDIDLVVSCPDKPYNGVYLFEATGDDWREPFKKSRRIDRGLRNVRVINSTGAAGRLIPRVFGPNVEYQDFLEDGFSSPKPLGVADGFHRLVGMVSSKTRANQWNAVDFDGDGDLDLSVGIGDWSAYGWDDAFDSKGNWANGALHGFVYIAENSGTDDAPKYQTPQLLRTTSGEAIDVYGWPSPNFADFDGDGDLDLLCGEFLDGFSYFQNVGSRAEPRYATGRKLSTSDGKQLHMSLQMVVPSAIDFDKDGDTDLVVGDEDGRVALIEHTGDMDDDGLPVLRAPVYFRQAADRLKCGALSTPCVVDWDHDGDEDIVCGNTAGFIELFTNLGGSGHSTRWSAPSRLVGGNDVIRIQAGPNGSIQGPCEAKWGYTTISIGDWDHDGKFDIVANSIWGKVIWFRNIGTEREPKLTAAQPVSIGDTPETFPKPKWNWWNPSPGELVTQWRTTPVVVDWNGDGLNDLVMLDHEGYLALYERYKSDSGVLSLRHPQRIFVDAKSQPIRLNSGEAGRSGRRKLSVADWDGDGRLDVIVNSVNADWYHNEGELEGRVTLSHQGQIATRVLSSHTTSPATCDLNRDGRLDLLLGAEDGHLYYLPSEPSNP